MYICRLLLVISRIDEDCELKTMKRTNMYFPPDFELLDLLVEDRTLLTDASGSQFDDIIDDGEGGGDDWEIL